MTVYSAFTIPTLGMMGQSHALATIGNNIANVTTGGFKRTDTNFQTLLSQTMDKQSDLGGVKPKDLNQITQQGNMVVSNRDLDLAINGQGFFIFNSSLTGGGQTYYGRDGSFEMASVNTISVAGTPTVDASGNSTPTTITAKDGYLVDKNGYYLQGWTADPATGLFTSTSLSALRIDPYAFAASGQATTTAALEMNLPATDVAGKSQVTEVALSGTIDAGDVYSVDVAGTPVNYTVTAADAALSLTDATAALNGIRDSLVTALNANATVSALATASASPTDGKILITGATQGTALTITSSTPTDVGTTDAQAIPDTVQAAATGDVNFHNIEVFDSNGAARSARLDFAKTDTNTWNLSTTVGKTPVGQVDTVTLAGTVEVGDVYSVVLNGTTFSKTAGAADTLGTIRDALVTSINADASIPVTAAAGGAGALTLTADTAGTSFTAVASASNGGATADNTATGVNTTANVSSSDTTTTSVTTLVFNEDGSLATPSGGSVTLALTFPAVGSVAAGTASVTMDISGLTQFAGSFQPFSYTKNGFVAANAQSIKFDNSGQVIATFDDSSFRAVYKIPLAQFANANALEEYNGNVYRETEESGTARVVDVDSSGYASFLPNTHELSNVDLADEFTRMMMTQTAYNSSATVFKTVDEMTTAARDLKK